MRKLITILLVATLLIPNFALAETATETVEYATEPDTVTRAEFARVIAMMLNVEIELEQPESRFVDVSEHWAYEYIRFLESRDIIRGDGYGYFRPDDVIIYQEAITMLMRALEYQPMVNARGGFPIGYMVAAVSAGVTRNVGNVGMTAFVTRDLAQTLVNNALDAYIMPAFPRPCQPDIDRIIYTIFPSCHCPLWTLRTEYWNEQLVYFDGENFIIPENE